MELPEVGYGKCCLAEEELTLTPHHTPSQSFDFIVWDKAYLDSISADTPTSSCTASTTTSASTRAACHNCDDYRSACAAHKAGAVVHSAHTSNSSPCPMQTLSSSKSFDSALLSCKTDADLPPCLIAHPLRLSDGGELSATAVAGSYNGCSCARCDWMNFQQLTSLEAAVRRRYVEQHNTKLRQGIAQFMQDCSTQDHPCAPCSSCCNDFQDDCHKQRTTVVSSSYAEPKAHVKSGSSSSTGLLGKALYLTRSISQPGVLSSIQNASADTKAADHNMNATLSKLAYKRNRHGHVSGRPGIDHDRQGKDQSMPVQDHAKLSCFPTGSISPGRQRRGHSILETPFSGRHEAIHQGCRENGVAAEAAALQYDAHKYHEDFITLDMHDIQEAKHELQPAISPKSIHMRAAAGRSSSTPPLPRVPAGMDYASAAPGFHTHTWSRSLSEKSSHSCSSNDLYFLQNGAMPKLRWRGGLNHRLRALWRKFCSPYLSPCIDKCETV